MIIFFCAGNFSCVCMWWGNVYVYGRMILWNPSQERDATSDARCKLLGKKRKENKNFEVGMNSILYDYTFWYFPS